ncbi:MAG: hypothetical protein ACSLE9_11065 [Burkholderiaceae bacterium]
MQSLDLQFWWNMALSVATSALAIVTWIRKPGEDASKAVSELREMVRNEMSDLQKFQSLLEERIRHLPARDEVSELAGDMKAVKAQMGSLVGTQSVQTLALNRIENWLINGRTHP